MGTIRELGGNALALGRYWGSADNARVTCWPEGDASVLLTWADGARISFDTSTSAEAFNTLERLGFEVRP